MQNLLYENEFDLHLNGLVGKPHFHMKGFTLGLVLKQRQRELWRGGGGQGCGSPGVMGAGGLRKAGEEGAGGGISKRGGSWEKWEIFRNIGTIFRNRKSTRRREPLWKGDGNRDCRVREAGCSDPPCPPPPRTRKGPINAT